MGRLLAIDYGRRRCGIAVTDTMQICANGLTTVATGELIDWVLSYIGQEPVDAIIVGEPRDMKGNPSDSQRYITPGINRLRKLLPAGVPIVFHDERFTTVLAHKSMLAGGMKKMARRDKAIVDEISATIILNDYLSSLNYRNSHN